MPSVGLGLAALGTGALSLGLDGAVGALAAPFPSGASGALNASGAGAGAGSSRELQALAPTNTRHNPCIRCN
jgi:hypothetical protein